MEKENSKMIDLFLREVCAGPPLSRGEATRLSRAALRGDAPARNKIALRNMRFVVRACEMYEGQGVPRRDMYIEGFLALYEAARRFKPDVGTNFISYAAFWVRQRVVQALANQRPGYSRPARFFISQRAIRKAQAAGVPCISAETGLTGEAIRKIEQLAQPVISTTAGEWRAVGDTIRSDTPAPDASAERTCTQGTIDSALGALTERERYVLTRHFGLQGAQTCSLAEVGDKLNLSHERIRQIKEGALKKLKYDGGIRELCLTS